MVTIQRYFVYSLMFNFLCLVAMEPDKVTKLNANTCAEDIRTQIDSYHLGMSEGTCFRPVVSAFLSWCKSTLLTYQQAEDEMNRIESYIPTDIDAKRVLNKLVTDHWYVNYLMLSLVCSKTNELENVTGLTIDKLYENSGGSDAQIITGNIAHTMFFGDFIAKKLIDIMPTVLSDVHFTVLYGTHGDIQPSSLCMSGDSKYLRANDENNVDSIWDMQTGEIADAQQIARQDIVWFSGHTYADDKHKNKHMFGSYACPFQEKYRVIDQNDKYCAMVTDADMAIDSDFFARDIAYNRKAIVLFVRPQEASYMCQKAFYNSYMEKNELVKLSQSNAIQVIEGFPKKNLETFVEKRVKQLSPQASSPVDSVIK